MYTCIHIYIYMYTCIHIHIYVIILYISSICWRHHLGALATLKRWKRRVLQQGWSELLSRTGGAHGSCHDSSRLPASRKLLWWNFRLRLFGKLGPCRSFFWDPELSSRFLSVWSCKCLETKAHKNRHVHFPINNSGWWFGTIFIFHNIWDNPSHWLIFFRGVETTNQFLFCGL